MADITTFGFSYGVEQSAASVVAVLNNPANTDIEITGDLIATGGSTLALINNPNLNLSGGGSVTFYMPEGADQYQTNEKAIAGFYRVGSVSNLTFKATSAVNGVPIAVHKTPWRVIAGSPSAPPSGQFTNVTFEDRPLVFGTETWYWTFKRKSYHATYGPEAYWSDYSGVDFTDCEFEFGWKGCANDLTMTRCVQIGGDYERGWFDGHGNTFTDCAYNVMPASGFSPFQLTAQKFYPSGYPCYDNTYTRCTFDGAWEESVGNDGATFFPLTTATSASGSVTVNESIPAGFPFDWGAAYGFAGWCLVVSDKRSPAHGKWGRITGYNAGTFSVSGDLDGLAAGDQVQLQTGFSGNTFDDCIITIGYGPATYPEGTNVGVSLYSGAVGNTFRKVKVVYNDAAPMPTARLAYSGLRYTTNWFEKMYSAVLPSWDATIPRAMFGIGFHEYTAGGQVVSTANVFEDCRTEGCEVIYEYDHHFQSEDTVWFNGRYESFDAPTQTANFTRGGRSVVTGLTHSFTQKAPNLPAHAKSIVWDAEGMTWSGNDHAPETWYGATGHGHAGGRSPVAQTVPGYMPPAQLYSAYGSWVHDTYGVGYYDDDWGWVLPASVTNYSFDWMPASFYDPQAPDVLNVAPVWGQESGATFALFDAPLDFDITLDVREASVPLPTATDSGSGTDTASLASIVRTPSATDTGAGTDAATVTRIVTFTATDTGASTDTASLAGGAFGFDIVLDVLSDEANLPTATDNGAGTDSASLVRVAAFTATDDGVGTDTAALLAIGVKPLPDVTDAGVGYDRVTFDARGELRGRHKPKHRHRSTVAARKGLQGKR